MAAAIAQFARRGVARTKVEDIAAAAGVTVGTVYRYFADKQALFEAAMAQGCDRLARAIATPPGRAEPPPLLLARIRAALDDPPSAAIAFLALAEAHESPLVAERWRRTVLIPARDALARSFAAKGVPAPHPTAAAALALLVGYALRGALGPGLAVDPAACDAVLARLADVAPAGQGDGEAG